MAAGGRPGGKSVGGFISSQEHTSYADAVEPAEFLPVRVLLVRWTMEICALFGAIAPSAVELLPWWQFEQACELVEDRRREVQRRG